MLGTRACLSLDSTIRRVVVRDLQTFADAGTRKKLTDICLEVETTDGEVALAVEAGSRTETKMVIAIGTGTASEMTETVIGTESAGNGNGIAKGIGTGIETEIDVTETGTGIGRGIGETEGNGPCPHAGTDAIQVVVVAGVVVVDFTASRG